MYTLQQGQRVSTAWGDGRIVGCATTELPILGRYYIVQFATIISEDYPFNTLSVPEIQIKKI